MGAIIFNIIKSFAIITIVISFITVMSYKTAGRQSDIMVGIHAITYKMDVINKLIVRPDIINVSELFKSRKLRKTTDNVIIHHSASSKDKNILTIDKYHKSRGWKSIAYTFFISESGKIYQLHNINAVDASALGFNNNSVSVCIAGNFDKEYINKKQYYSLLKVLIMLKNKYPKATIKGHKELNGTNCPGTNLNINTISQHVSTFHWLKLLKN